MNRYVLLALSLAAAPHLPAAAAPCGPDALGVARTIEIGGPATAVGLKTYPRTLALADGEFVLTFDDGPNPPTTDKVLKALAAQCARATFFLIGRNAAAAPATVKAEIAAGHTIGHHSMTHPAVTLRNLTDEAARADIDRGFAADDAAAYGAATAEPRVKFFRFPGFGDTKKLGEWLNARGVTIFGADLWASDWEPVTAQAELDRLVGRMEKAHKGIVLLHDTIPATADMLPDLLAEMKKRGWRLVHILPGKGPTPLEEAKPGWKSETEATLAHMWPKAPAKPKDVNTDKLRD